MITFISGAPGTGKSNALVSMLMGIYKDRAIYANGIPDLKVNHLELEDATRWHELVPDGSLIVIDEAQNVFRPRGPGQKVPDHVAKLETHRHRGLDFIIISQGPNLIDSNVRALVGRHVYLRDLGVLGRWWYEWPECADNCRTSWKNAPIRQRYKLDKVAQANYRSASLHVKPVRSFPRMLIVLAVMLCIVPVLGWRAYAMVQAKLAPTHEQQKPSKLDQAGKQVQADPVTSGYGSQAKAIDDRIDWIPRVSSRPESAPAFDQLRKVVAMPVVVGCMQFKGVTKCFTQQGTDAGLDAREAHELLARPRFDPYSAPKAIDVGSLGSDREKPLQADPAPTLVVLEGPGRRDPLGAQAVKR